MRQDEVFEKLRATAEETPATPALPTEAEVRAAEEALDITFPPSYRAFLLELSNVTVGTYEPLVPNSDWPYLNLLANVTELREVGLPTRLVPFMVDNGDAFCFDVGSDGPEYAVVLWAHDDQSIVERFPDFLSWVEQQWLTTAEASESADEDQ